jgi:hypothetical protein
MKIPSIVVLSAALALPFAFMATGAHADTVTFSGTGTWSNLNCNGCSISGNSRVLDMSGNNNSTITINNQNNVSFSVPPNQNDVVLGSLTWVNNASTGTDQNFSVHFNFTLSFTSPNNSSDSQTFDLTITQPTNPPGDHVFNISNATLANLGPFNLNGISVSDIHFALASGDNGTYDGSQWSNPENNTSVLRIVADFSATATPLPAALPLFAGGLGALGLLGWRRKRAARNVAV